MLEPLLLSSNSEKLAQVLLLGCVCFALGVKARERFVGALLQLLDIEADLSDIWVLVLIRFNDHGQNMVQQVNSFYRVRG